MRAAHPLGDADQVIRTHSKLVHYVAKRYKWALSPSLDYSDLVSEGTVGLLKAYNGFDVSKGYQFSTYASRMIRWEIQQHLRQREQVMRVSDRLYFLAGSILRQGLREERPAEIARNLSCSETEAEEALNYLNVYVESMNRPLPGADNETATIEDRLLVLDDYSEIETQEFLQTLTKRERRLVDLRIAGTPYAEIIKKMRLSILQTSNALKKIGEKYRRYTEVDGMAAKLTKEKYLDYKSQNKSDKDIRSIYGFGEPTMTRLKKEWGIAGMRRVSVPQQDDTPPAQSLPEVAPVSATPIPDSSLQRLRDELDGIKPVLVRLERENELLRALLKNYL